MLDSNIELNVSLLANPKPSLFELGRIVKTASSGYWAEDNLPEALLESDTWAAILLQAHRTGYWDEMPIEDQNSNKQALSKNNPERVVSAYTIIGQKFFVITEWDRSVTTVMLANDY